MKTYPVTIPEIALVAMTRGIAGAGIGLLLADKLPRDTRRVLGWALLGVGVVTTIPIIGSLIGSRRPQERAPAIRLSDDGPSYVRGQSE